MENYTVNYLLAISTKRWSVAAAAASMIAIDARLSLEKFSSNFVPAVETTNPLKKHSALSTTYIVLIAALKPIRVTSTTKKFPCANIFFNLTNTRFISS